MTSEPVRSGDVLWTPPPDARTTTRLGRFIDSLERRAGRPLTEYEDAWAWSVENLEDFWAAIWEEFDIPSSQPYVRVLAERAMPGARWFEGARLNYAELILDALREQGDEVAVVARSQTTGSSELSGHELRALVGSIQAGLRAQGVVAGDRVAGYLPNAPEAVACYLAVVGLGATWLCVPPEMGPRSALDRIQPLAPRVLIAVDGYRWGARDLPRLDDLERIAEALPDTQIVLLPYLDPDSRVEGYETWGSFTAEAADPKVVHVPFDHPLVVLFSSGTTGAPKAIVHGHGGILLEHLKAIALQMDLGPTDTTFWFSTTGWMVWNLQVSALLVGARIVLVDGDPNWPSADGPWSQWAIAAETRATFLATGAAYLGACARAGLRPGERWDLSRLREINSSGSPLGADTAAWVYDAVNPTLLLAPTSGGTDICSAFVGGSPLTPVYAGEMSCRPLGVAVDALNADGLPLVGEPGELVVSLPMPSMPLGFWGDTDGSRYRAAYFEDYPGRWRHGDWLIHTVRGTWVITGRSDATLNRGGVRLGTSEYYGVLDPMPAVLDSTVVHFEDAAGMGTLVLAIHAAAGVDRDALTATVRTAIRSELSPRHVPDVVVYVPGIPRNRTGKRLEIPLKRLVTAGADQVLDPSVLDPSVLVDPDSLAETVDVIRRSLP
jgi:acetoacetyl-CoA synthetase